MSWRLASWLCLGLGLAGAGFYVTPPGAEIVSGAVSGAVFYLCLAALGTAMSVAGIWQGPRSRRRIWVALAVGEILYLGGDVLWVLYDNVFYIAPYPSFADVSYLLKYVACAIGLAWLIRGRRPGRDRAAFLDAAIITTGFTVIATAFLVIPAAALGGETLLSKVVAGAYPAADVLLLAMIIRLFATRASRSLAFGALVLGTTVLLASDIYYTLTIVSGGVLPLWLDLGYLTSYLLMGFCAMHPSSRALTEPLPTREDSVTIWRVGLLGLSSVVAPVLLLESAIRGAYINPYLLGLGAIVGGGLVLARLFDLLLRAQAQAVQLAALARNDGLTGIANRRTWDHELSRACAQARESGHPLTVALVDLDHFKTYNDTHGHLMGDLVLKETAAAWKEILGNRGFLARYGGEEFALIIPASPTTAVALLDRLARAVSRGQTCSIGVAAWDGVEDPSAATSRADQAMYFAKRSGRDRIALHDGEHIRGTENSDRDLYAFSTVFQPVVDLATGERIGHEALSRFPDRTPVEAFGEARRTGSLAELEIVAIEKALASWSGAGWLSLNVSPSTLLDEKLRAVLPDDLSQIVLEITEEDLLDWSPLADQVLADLRTRGVRIAIDDMGVGYSNLQRLLAIAPDMIKIDRSLVQDVHDKPLNQAVLRAMVAYAREAGSQICAEGIEQPGEWEALTAAGVTLGQGYLFGRPAPLTPRPRTTTENVSPALAG